MQAPRGLSLGDVVGLGIIGLLLVGAAAWIVWGLSTYPSRRPAPAPAPHVGKVVESAGVEMGDAVVRFTDGTMMRVHTFGRKLVID